MTVENLCDWLTEPAFDNNYLITQAYYGKNFQNVSSLKILLHFNMQHILYCDIKQIYCIYYHHTTVHTITYPETGTT